MKVKKSYECEDVAQARRGRLCAQTKVRSAMIEVYSSCSQKYEVDR